MKIRFIKKSHSHRLGDDDSHISKNGTSYHSRCIRMVLLSISTVTLVSLGKQEAVCYVSSVSRQWSPTAFPQVINAAARRSNIFPLVSHEYAYSSVDMHNEYNQCSQLSKHDSFLFHSVAICSSMGSSPLFSKESTSNISPKKRWALLRD